MKNSEYIEEDELRRSSLEHRQNIIFNSNIIASEDVKFEFTVDGGTGGAAKVNRSFDQSQIRYWFEQIY